jgi:sec-independent protein translocase protein TatB
MFEVGFWELALIFALGLVVLGPDKLPTVARQLGRWVGQARRMASNLSYQIQHEMDQVERQVNQVDPPTSAASSTPASVPEAPESFQRPGVDDLIPKTVDDAGITADTGSSHAAPRATGTH